jgi:hypothetical protein
MTSQLLVHVDKRIRAMEAVVEQVCSVALGHGAADRAVALEAALEHLRSITSHNPVSQASLGGGEVSLF